MQSETFQAFICYNFDDYGFLTSCPKHNTPRQTHFPSTISDTPKLTYLQGETP